MKGRVAAIMAAAAILLGFWGGAGFAEAGPTPTKSEILHVMHSYREVGTAGETYSPDYHGMAHVSDGASAIATAVVGTRSPSADGYGQLVFFFYNNHFVGLNSPYEAVSVKQVVAVSNGVFRVTYADYKPSDPLFDPSLGSISITYHVHAHSLAASAPLKSGVNDSSGKAQRERAAARRKITTTASSFVEAGVSGESYRPLWHAVKTTAGAGGAVDTAVPVVRWPTADGYGQLVLFFNGDRFVGLNSSSEATSILSVTPAGPARFRVTYANYSASDALYDPTLPPVTITYMIVGGVVKASSPLPPGVRNKLGAVPKPN